MPKITEETVREVRERLRIDEVAEGLGVRLRKGGSDDMTGLCPLHQEKSPSFHVHPARGYFKCFGCGEKGDAVKLLMKVRGMTFPEAVEEGARMAGVLVRHEQRRPLLERVAVGATAPAEVARDESEQGGGEGLRVINKCESPANGGGAAVAEAVAAPAEVFRLPPGVTERQAVRALKRQARYEADRARERRADEAWLASWTAEGAPRRLEAWSARVEERFEGGAATAERIKALADARGWPEHWVGWLADEGLLRWPLAPWADFQGNERDLGEVALRVDKPALRRAEGGGWALAGAQPVGYHQRFEAAGRRMWRFVPYWPRVEGEDGRAKRVSSFQHGLIEELRARAAAEGEAVVPPLPFVIGASESTRFLVITEGQWDAVAFAGEAGWLDGDSAWPVGAAVMGVRGSTGFGPLLAYWGWWLERVRPAVLVLADNDAAGLKWDHARRPERPGEVAEPTFAQRLLRRPEVPERGEVQWVPRARRVEVRRVASGAAKDFDDWRRVRKPGPARMAAWLRDMGFMGAGGAWL